jgi:molecular chaperone Hsp33
MRQLLGELSALALMLANGLKHKGKVSLQIQGSGAISLLLVEVTHSLKIRGMLRGEKSLDKQLDLDELLGDAQIVATVYNAQTQHSFQSIVPRNPQGMIATFEDYFSQSEQLEAKIYIASTAENLSALLVQKMPKTKTLDTDAWNRIIQLTNTVKAQELCSTDAPTLAKRLFHEEVFILYEGKEVKYECQPNRARFEKIIFDLGEVEARSLLKERGEIAIHHEICNEHLFFNQADVDRIFS